MPTLHIFDRGLQTRVSQLLRLFWDFRSGLTQYSIPENQNNAKGSEKSKPFTCSVGPRYWVVVVVVVPLLLEETAAAKPAAIAAAATVPATPKPARPPARPPVVAPVAPATVAFTGTGACAITDVDVAATNAIIDTILNVLFMCKSYVPTIPRTL